MTGGNFMARSLTRNRGLVNRRRCGIIAASHRKEKTVTVATFDEFDTLRLVKNMTGKGMPEAQAEELAESMRQYQNRLVTRDYLDKRLAEQDARLAQMETRMTTRMLWISGGMAGIIITVLGTMMQTLLGGGG